MSSWSNIMYSILGAGTFTRYGSQPTTVILFAGSIRVKGVYILLEDEDEETHSDHTGKILFKEKMGTLSIFTGTETDRDNLELDIRDILLTQTNYSFEILGENPSVPQKNVFVYTMLIKILD